VFLYDLGPDYYTRLPRIFSQITLNDIHAAARKYFGPSTTAGPAAKIVTVAVGDLARIEPELRKLSLGPIEIRNPDGSLQRQQAE
jgi:zinc protease